MSANTLKMHFPNYIFSIFAISEFSPLFFLIKSPWLLGHEKKISDRVEKNNIFLVSFDPWTIDLNCQNCPESIIRKHVHAQSLHPPSAESLRVHLHIPIPEGFRKENADNTHFFRLQRPEITFFTFLCVWEHFWAALFLNFVFKTFRNCSELTNIP